MQPTDEISLQCMNEQKYLSLGCVSRDKAESHVQQDLRDLQSYKPNPWMGLTTHVTKSDLLLLFYQIGHLT